jgi:hypothetical protein
MTQIGSYFSSSSKKANSSGTFATMALPAPVPGLVVRYSYLWNQEYRQGRRMRDWENEDTNLATRVRADHTDDRAGAILFTFVTPSDMEFAVEIPAKVKERLALGQEQSWVVLSEWNEFIWPGPDLRLVHGAEFSVAYGVLPPSFFSRLRDRFVALAEAGGAKRVVRT